MGKQRKTRQFAAVKRIINPKDARTDQKEAEDKKKALEEKKKQDLITHAPVPSSAMFFKYNTALGPPYHILVDTNFINFSIQNKLDMIDSMMDCLLAKCTPVITDCVMSELEKLGPKFRVALKMAKNPRFERLTCTHSGLGYADDCLVHQCNMHKCYIVATCDKDLKRRVRKIPGIPIMYITAHKYAVERLPDNPGDYN